MSVCFSIQNPGQLFSLFAMQKGGIRTKGKSRRLWVTYPPFPFIWMN
jgi:hypothetical protein